jgi:hypothetical protein
VGLEGRDRTPKLIGFGRVLGVVDNSIALQLLFFLEVGAARFGLVGAAPE